MLEGRAGLELNPSPQQDVACLKESRAATGRRLTSPGMAAACVMSALTQAKTRGNE